MNREEAIKLLQMYEINKQGEAELHTWYSGIDNDMREVMNMAISALKREQQFMYNALQGTTTILKIDNRHFEVRERYI